MGVCFLAHVAKWKRSSIGHLTKHFERGKDEQNNYVKFGNQDIKPDLTPLNYNLATHQTLDQIEFIHKRCNEVKCLNRDNVNVLCSWIVTAPKSLPVEENEQFFKETYKFLSCRYGEKNVVSSYVHLDETTPHMHFAFVPVTLDKKKNIEKVSAKEILTKNELKVFHGDLENYLTKTLGHEIHILNEATKNGNISINDLKRKSAQERLAEIHEITKNNVIASQKGLADAEKKASEIVQNAILKVEKMDKLLNTLKQEEKMLQEQINTNKRTLNTFYEIECLGKSSMFGKLILTSEEADRLKEQAKAYFAEKSNAEKAKIEISKIKKQMLNTKKSASYQENEKLKEEIKDLKNTIYDLKKSNNQMISNIKNFNKVLEKNPELIKLFKEAEKTIEQEQRQWRYNMGMER